MTNLIRIFVLAMKTLINIKYTIFTAVNLLLQKMCILIKLIVIIRKI